MDGQEVNVVADNTDVLILLMHHLRVSMAYVYILSQPMQEHIKERLVSLEAYVIWLPKLEP